MVRDCGGRLAYEAQELGLYGGLEFDHGQVQQFDSVFGEGLCGGRGGREGDQQRELLLAEEGHVFVELASTAGSGQDASGVGSAS